MRYPDRSIGRVLAMRRSTWSRLPLASILPSYHFSAREHKEIRRILRWLGASRLGFGQLAWHARNDG